MRIISILGVISLFFPIYIKFNSKRALLVMLNGIIYHSNERNRRVRYYDLICNMLMCYYTYHINSSSWPYILFSSMNCIINELMLQHNYISKITNDIYHVSLVQSPLALGLYRLKSGLL